MTRRRAACPWPARGKQKRYQTIKVQWQNEQFQTRIKTFTGWAADHSAHEIDHCEGIFDMILCFPALETANMSPNESQTLGDVLVNLNDRIKASRHFFRRNR